MTRATARLGLLRRQLKVILAMACGLPLWIGVPAPAPAPEKDTSRPFPCMYRRCGCRSADDCLKDCCCFSRDQKLAWFRDRGLAPPEEAVAEPEAIVAADESPSACPYCLAANSPPSEPAPPACFAVVNGDAATCCDEPKPSDAGCCGKSQAAAEGCCPKSPPPARGLLPAWDAFRCQGFGSSEGGLVLDLPPPPVVLLPAGRVTELVARVPDLPGIALPPPPAPPPRSI